jgi:hypothetical protein
MTLQLKNKFLMRLLYKFANIIFLFLVFILMSSCSFISSDLSCKYNEIDCYRFDYKSIDSFKASVKSHASEWGLMDPSSALSDQIINKELSIHSLKDSELLIKTNPRNMFVLGRYLLDNQKSREWLFVSEQAFIRSWNKLGR